VNAAELVGRMLLALGAVLGIMWALARFARRPLAGKADSVLTVLARQQLNRSSSVAVLKVMDRALVVGVSDQGVRLLAETELSAIEAALVVSPKTTRREQRDLVDQLAQTVIAEQPAGPAAALPSAGLPSAGLPSAGLPSAGLPSAGLPASAASTQVATVLPTKKNSLDGSILSPRTWSQLVNVARDVTVRR
jgi:flagellar protein FliO/FliZ